MLERVLGICLKGGRAVPAFTPPPPPWPCRVRMSDPMGQSSQHAGSSAKAGNQTAPGEPQGHFYYFLPRMRGDLATKCPCASPRPAPTLSSAREALRAFPEASRPVQRGKHQVEVPGSGWGRTWDKLQSCDSVTCTAREKAVQHKAQAQSKWPGEGWMTSVQAAET